jgi:ADP-ribosylglycohydrolase
MTFPADYVERVYAGILGKLIGVYLGRPFEGWSYERIMSELGEIWKYVHEQRGLPLIVTDDDISGTFTFIRALEDYGYPRHITPAQIGQTWLNYLVEGKTILSWAGLGCSTEHTAYLRLKHGIPAPFSGSIEMNGTIVAEQIGSQIFIDSWAMVAPGDPEFAAELAKRAASVSHDGEAIYGAQLLAAMESQAFVEKDRFALIDIGLSVIPNESHIYRMVCNLREYHAKDRDWRKGREFIEKYYGYDTYLGGCHIVPNSALILLGYLYGDDDFQKSLMITNTSGWDTDCNSGNLGCLLGIKNGLMSIDASPFDFREPVADRMYLPTADGGRAITDAVQETYYLVNTARHLAGVESLAPKNGARYHFELPGSLQGFLAQRGEGLGNVTLSNEEGHSCLGSRSLKMNVENLAPGQKARVAVSTFIPPEALTMPGYGLLASPTLYPGQLINVHLQADKGNLAAGNVQLFVHAYDPNGTPCKIDGACAAVEPGQTVVVEWLVPETGGAPIFEVGIELDYRGIFYLDALSWEGTPDVNFDSPERISQIWRKAWINNVQHWEGWSDEPYRIVQNEGRGMISTGTRTWRNYQFEAEVRPAFLVKTGGIGVCVQGTERYYALLLTSERTVRLIKRLDGERVLAEKAFPFELWQMIRMRLAVEAISGVRLQAWMDGELFFDLEDNEQLLESGGIALMIEEGHFLAKDVSVKPVAG